MYVASIKRYSLLRTMAPNLMMWQAGRVSEQREQKPPRRLSREFALGGYWASQNEGMLLSVGDSVRFAMP